MQEAAGGRLKGPSPATVDAAVFPAATAWGATDSGCSTDRVTLVRTLFSTAPRLSSRDGSDAGWPGACARRATVRHGIGSGHGQCNSNEIDCMAESMLLS